MRARIGIAAVVAALTLIVSGCSSATLDRQAGAGVSLTIGSASTFPDQVVAQLYGQALAADGFDIDYNTGVRGRTRLLAALEAGHVHLVPVPIGDMLQSVSPGSTPGDAAATALSLENAVEASGVQVLTPSAAQESVVFVTTSMRSRSTGVTGLDEVRTMPGASLAGGITIASTSSIDDAHYGRQALENSYGVSGWTARVESSVAAVLDDVRTGRAQLGVVPTTTPELYSGDTLTVLDDPSRIVLPQNLVPLARTAVATREVGRVVDAVSSRLQTRDLSDFAARSDELPATVARDWLENQHLLATP